MSLNFPRCTRLQLLPKVLLRQTQQKEGRARTASHGSTSSRSKRMIKAQCRGIDDVACGRSRKEKMTFTAF